MKKINTIALMAISMIMLLLVSACTVTLQQPTPTRVLSATGNAELDVMPDVAKMYFSVQTNASTAQAAQSQNSELANKIVLALKKAGVVEKDIDTTNYRVEKIQEWEYDSSGQGRYVDKGFRAINSFVVSTTDMQRVGLLLDTAVEAGANNVDYINFELSTEKQATVKAEALQKATVSAKEKAKALSDGAGVTLGKISSIAESSYYVDPWPRYDYAMVKESMSGSAPTPISPGDVTVTAQVLLTYDLG